MMAHHFWINIQDLTSFTKVVINRVLFRENDVILRHKSANFAFFRNCFVTDLEIHHYTSLSIFSPIGRFLWISVGGSKPPPPLPQAGRVADDPRLGRVKQLLHK